MKVIGLMINGNWTQTSKIRCEDSQCASLDMRRIFFLAILIMTPFLMLSAEETINSGPNTINITPTAELFLEKGDSLTIEEVAKKEFKKYEKKHVGFKPSGDTYWWKLSGIQKFKDVRYLTINNVHLDYATLYYKNGTRWEKSDAGDLSPFWEREVIYKYPTFDIADKNEIYIRVRAFGVMSFNFELSNLSGFNKKKVSDIIVDVSFFSILFIMFAYNLFVFFSSKSSRYGYYCLYLMTLFVWHFFNTGWINTLFDPGKFFRNDFVVLAVLLVIMSSIMLTISFLDLKSNMPVAYKILFGKFIYIFALSIACLNYEALKIILVHIFYQSVKVSAAIVMTVGGIAFVRSYKSNWEKMRTAKFYFPGYFLYAIGALCMSSVYSGSIPANFYTLNFWKVTIIMEIVLIALGLADIINTLRKAEQKKSEELAQSNASLADLNVNLEKKVMERTEQLNHTLSETSSLLNNMKQSVFSVNNEGVIIAPVSEYSNEMFGDHIEGKSLYDTLLKDMSRDDEVFSTLKFTITVSVGEDDYQFAAMEENLPAKVIMLNKDGDDRSMKISYSPILDKDDIVEKLMLVVEDVTDIENLERESKEKEAASREKIQKLQEIVSNDKKDLKLFVREVNLNLSLSKKSIDVRDLKGFFRAAHTLKGNARMYGMNGLSQILHILESKIDELRNDPPEESLLKDIMEGIDDSIQLAVEEYLDLAREIFGHDIDETYLAGGSDSIELSRKLFLESIDEIKEAVRNNDVHLIDDIVRKLETEEFKVTLESLKNTVQRISTSLRKDILLKIEGDDIYMDVKTSSVIKDSIMHIIQNSCDHGIEKNGTITVVLRNNTNNIVIDISDNGRGIDHEMIYRKAIEKGLVTKEESQDFNKKKKLELIMTAGFSTKEVATEYSGRGVGMDVVKTNIASLGGTVALDSIVGEGTSFVITVPLNGNSS